MKWAPAPLPGRAEEHRRDGLLQAGVSVADDQLHPAQPAGLQATQERGPKRPVLGVTDLEAKHLTTAVRGHPGGDHDRLGHHPPVHPGLAVGRVQEHVRVTDLGQRPVPERTDFFVEVRTDPRDLGLADPGVGAERFDQVVDLARGHAVQVGLHDHREQRLVDPTPAFQQAREERSGPKLGDPQLQVTSGRGQDPAPRAVALSRALIGAFPRARADHTGQLGVDQRLVDRLGRRADPVLNTGSLHWLPTPQVMQHCPRPSCFKSFREFHRTSH
jgi:hypothetical protein